MASVLGASVLDPDYRRRILDLPTPDISICIFLVVLHALTFSSTCSMSCKRRPASVVAVALVAAMLRPVLIWMGSKEVDGGAESGWCVALRSQ